jgi:hypothetical protein
MEFWHASLLAAVAVVLWLFLWRRREMFANPACADRYMQSGAADALRQQVKCSPNSAFPGLRRHPDDANSCYLSMEEPLIRANAGGCSLSNDALGGVAGLVNAARDTSVDCLETVCRVEFAPNTSDAARDAAAVSLLNANGKSTPAVRAELDAARQLQTRFDALQATYQSTVQERDAARLSVTECGASKDLLNSQLASANGTVTRCATDKASLSSQMAALRRNTVPGGSWLQSCRFKAYNPDQTSLTAVCDNGSGGQAETTASGCATYFNDFGALRCEGVPMNPQGAVPPPQPQPQVTLCDDAGLHGRCVDKPEGRYDLMDMGIANDTMSSVKVPRGLKVTLFKDMQFGGKRRTIVGPAQVDDFGSTRWEGDMPWSGSMNDQVSSYIIERA